MNTAMAYADASLVLYYVEKYKAENYEAPTQRELQSGLNLSNTRVSMAIRLLKAAEACRFSNRNGQIIGLLGSDTIDDAMARVQRHVEHERMRAEV